MLNIYFFIFFCLSSHLCLAENLYFFLDEQSWTILPAKKSRSYTEFQLKNPENPYERISIKRRIKNSSSLLLLFAQAMMQKHPLEEPQFFLQEKQLRSSKNRLLVSWLTFRKKKAKDFGLSYILRGKEYIYEVNYQCAAKLCSEKERKKWIQLCKKSYIAQEKRMKQTGHCLCLDKYTIKVCKAYS